MSMTGQDYRAYLDEVEWSFWYSAKEAKEIQDRAWKAFKLARKFESTQAGRELVEELKSIVGLTGEFNSSLLDRMSYTKNVRTGQAEYKAPTGAFG